MNRPNKWNIGFVLTILIVLLYNATKIKKLNADHGSKTEPQFNRRVLQTQLLLEKTIPQNDTFLAQWLLQVYSGCEANFVAYNGFFAVFYNFTLNASKAQTFSSLKPITSVPQDSDELYKLEKAFLQMQCDQPVRYPFESTTTWWSDPLADLVQSVEVKPRKSDPQRTVVTGRLERRPTIIVQRREYLNLFHTATDWHNAFLMLVLFRLNVSDVQVLFLDAHAPGQLDNTWTMLFNRVERLSNLTEPVTYSMLISSIFGYKSLLFEPPTDHYIPLLDEYRRFVLLAHSLHDLVDRDLNCRKLAITFVSRRPYNQRRGKPLERMIANENELVDALYSYFITLSSHVSLHELLYVQLENLTFSEQLRIMSQTDVLIGMHGAGLTHTLHLPKRSALIELFPLNLQWEEKVLPLFSRMAKQRSLFYTSWRNKDPLLDKPGGYTYVPAAVILRLFNETLKNICS